MFWPTFEPRKTRTMINQTGNFHTGLSGYSYARRSNSDLPSYTERYLNIVQCPTCNIPIQRRSLAHHLKVIHNEQSITNHISQSTQKDQFQEPQQHLITSDQTTCPICEVVLKDNNTLRRHCKNRHPRDKLIGLN